MDTGDPPQDEAPKTATTAGKGKKKKKEKKTFTLDQFLAHDDGYSEPKSQNWAILSETAEDEYDAPRKFDRSTLPTAPKAAMGPKVDLSQIPVNGPFSAYVGNIPYDAKETDLMNFFCKLEVDNVRLIYDGGRAKGYAYVDFKTRESLLDALTYSDREFMGRNMRVDLATEKNQDTRGGPIGSRSNEPDRTEGDWRRKNPSSDGEPDGGSSFRDSDRGGRYGDRDRGFGERGGSGFDRSAGGGGFSDRSFGDRDRGFSDRDRGSFGGDRGSFGGDRDKGSSFGGDRDRGFGNDRDRGYGGDRDRGFGDRDRVGGGFSDRDRGFGSDRDRSYGGDRDRDRGFGHDRDRDRGFGNDRSSRGYGFNRDREEGGGRYGSRGGGGGGFEDRNRQDDFRRDEGRRDDYNRGRREDNFERKPASRDGSQEHSDAPKARPVLNLKPRTKPVENKENQPASRSSIFGAAKPVDTSAREKEIEAKLKKQGDEPSHPPSWKRDSDSESGWRGGDRHSGSGHENRRDSNEASAPTSRRDSEHSHTSEELVAGEEVGKSSSSSGTTEPTSKLIPAPPPKENAWAKKKESGTSLSSSSTSNVSNNASVPAQLADKKAGMQGPKGRGGPIKPEATPARRLSGDKVSSTSHNGPPASKLENLKNRPSKDKPVPKHIDEMPKYEDTKTKDFSDQNKFAFLLADEDREEDRESEGEDEEAAAVLS